MGVYTSWRARVDKWLRVSVRRQTLEKHLEALDVNYGARTMEVGAGRKGRRGEYKPRIKTRSIGITWIFALKYLLMCKLTYKTSPLLPRVFPVSCAWRYWNTLMTPTFVFVR